MPLFNIACLVLGGIFLILGVCLIAFEVRLGLQRRKAGADVGGSVFKDIFTMNVWMWAALGAGLIWVALT